MYYERMPFEWEKIYENMFEETSRAKVYGGWIVKHLTYKDTFGETIAQSSTVFISDPRHQWQIE